MYVTIHGHFYQPPRENPWTNEIPRQEGAAPFHDWNERIVDQCYGPNGHSRVLDPQGRIIAIVNNFEYLSFDFGPTLLSDLERRFPEVYRRILEADRRSQQVRGHGNAMAQAYNHMILPLANAHDRWTQVRWGLRDFERRFGRRSEGMWLPETAINPETLEAAAESGVRFLILAPSQAKRFRRLGEKSWHEVSAETPLDTSRPYRCFRSGRRSIDVFFYDTPLSVAVSFEHLLRRAESFASRLQDAGRGLPAEGLVHFATDGEIYGHHEPFGDMCLAYLFEREGPRRGLQFINYGQALSLHAPEHEVALNFGEKNEGTAWSCAHGVGRWIRDCGCSTGGRDGWNQRWRTPLRLGLDAVRDAVHRAFAARLQPVLKDCWAARDDYIEVLLHPDEETRERFLVRHLRAPADLDTRRMIWTLLEASHQAMLMYTSCAWFFADISGLEVQQNLAYAARACELAAPYLPDPVEPLLLRELAQARSNLAEWGDGGEIYRRLVLPRRVGPEHAAAQAAFEAAVLGRPLSRTIHRYAVEGASPPEAAGAESRGRVTVRDDQVGQSWVWDYQVTPGALQEREVRLRPEAHDQTDPVTGSMLLQLRDLKEEVREEIASSALRRSLREETDSLREIYEKARSPMRCLLELGLPVPEIHRHLACHVLHQRATELCARIPADLSALPEEWWSEVAGLWDEGRRLHLDCECGPLEQKLAQRIHALLDRALGERNPKAALESVAAAYDTLARADRLSLPLPRSGHEARAYDLVLRFRSELLSAPKEMSEAHGYRDGLNALRKLAGHANLQLEAILNHASATRRSPPAMVGGVHRDAKG